jgi:formylglycine-generating enzyme required for sulfatase activity
VKFVNRLNVFLVVASFCLTISIGDLPVCGQEVAPPVVDKVSAEKTKLKTDKERLGVASEKPADGPSVKIDGGFMIPYTATIPGTEVQFEMVPVAGGKFLMGSPEDEDDRRDDEGPQFNVVVEPFWMGKFEVTWDEYQTYMAMDRVFKDLNRKKIRESLKTFEVDAVTAPSELYDADFTYEAGDEYDQPAATMSQFAAKQYTKWLSLLSTDFYRLPYESEWEWACRAGTKTAYSFGDDADELENYGWFDDNSDEMRQVVGEKKPNAFGLFDMHGNVAEWVLDGYSEDGYSHLEAGKTYSVQQAFRKPTGVYPRVVRGGSWELEAADCRSAARLYSEEEWKSEDPNEPKSPWWFTDTPGLGVGFRLVRPLAVPKTVEDRNEFWKPDNAEIVLNAESRIDGNGRGALGKVDPKLAEEMKPLLAEDQ